MKYSLLELSRMIDHTNLKPNASRKDMEILCEQAVQYHFKMVAINQVQTKLCAQILRGTDVGIGAAISFPLGQTTIESKYFNTENAIEQGATEIDYVVNLTEVRARNWDYISKEMASIVEICQKHNVISKVIFENAYLTDDEKIWLCKIANEVGPDFIKTSTGFGTSGATLHDVDLMRKNADTSIKVKAAGGIRNVETFKKMIGHGAERIGTSSGIEIIEQLKLKNKDEFIF